MKLIWCFLVYLYTKFIYIFIYFSIYLPLFPYSPLFLALFLHFLWYNCSSFSHTCHMNHMQLRVIFFSPDSAVSCHRAFYSEHIAPFILVKQKSVLQIYSVSHKRCLYFAYVIFVSGSRINVSHIFNKMLNISERSQSAGYT